jgi:sn-glycerol 3-phosphate transport system permease protein
MVEHRPWLTWFTHAVLIIGVLIIAFPIYVAFVASTHELDVLLQSPIPLLPGDAFLKNYTQALLGGAKAVGVPVWVMMFNSLVMALGITIGSSR